MKKIYLDLQLCAGDEDIEIPEEFEGIDRDIAIDLMRENGLIKDDKTETDPEDNKPDTSTSANEPNSEPPKTDDQQTVNKESEPAGDTTPVKEPKTGEEDKTVVDNNVEENHEGDSSNVKDEDKKTVPYGALKDERGKRKAAQREAEALKAEIAQLRLSAQQPQFIAQQPVQGEQPVTAASQPNDEIIEKAALELFVQKYGREPDDLERSDNVKLASCTYQVNRNFEAYQAQQQRVAVAARQQSQSYRQFTTEQQQADDFEEVQTAFIDELSNLSPQEKQMFTSSYENCERGRGTPQDLFIIKKFWNDVANKYRKANSNQTEPPEKQITKEDTAATKTVEQPPTPPKPAKKTIDEKLKEIEKQPKANIVKGTNQSATVSVDEIARLMNEMPWPEFEKKYPEYAKMVLEG
jgi:hypothetical protein